MRPAHSTEKEPAIAIHLHACSLAVRLSLSLYGTCQFKISAMKIDPAWLEDQEGRDMRCFMVLDQPTTACPEGHALCRECYVMELSLRRKCPLCQHPTDPSRLQKCRPLEDFIGDLRMRCKHGPEVGDEDANLEPLQCGWRGRVSQLAAHLAESCAYEPVPCPNAAAGCQESVLRKDAARHASETCEYRSRRCAHCRALLMSCNLPVHERICPQAQIECPNIGCGVTVARRSMAKHRVVCGREQVKCPCLGCEERMAQVEVGGHVAGAVHLQMAWGRAVEMEEKVAEQDSVISKQERTLSEQAELIKEQNSTIAGLQGHCAEALTRVFTWSTDSAWSITQSLPYTFRDGVRGHCLNSVPANASFAHWIGFATSFTHFVGFQLEEGVECTMHFKCSILDKNDKVLRVNPEDDDFRKRPPKVWVGRKDVGEGRGAYFNLTAADTAGAARADGSIKLCMVVHLYLSEYYSRR